MAFITINTFFVRLQWTAQNIQEWQPIWQAFDFHHNFIFLVSLFFIFYATKEIGIRNTQGISLLFLAGIASLFVCA